MTASGVPGVNKVRNVMADKKKKGNPFAAKAKDKGSGKEGMSEGKLAFMEKMARKSGNKKLMAKVKAARGMMKKGG